MEAAVQVQALNNDDLDLEQALEEALRIGCLNATADLVKQASQLEQATAKLYGAWTQINKLAERVYVDSGASTPHLRNLLSHLEPLTSQTLEVQLGDPESPLSHKVRLQLLAADSGDT
ncbi:MAG: hypothetical protein ACFB0E_07600 [Leptolyngbyaceae cyanobacterium]